MQTLINCFKWYYALPFFSFLTLYVGEWILPTIKNGSKNFNISEWGINLFGLGMQGLCIPLLSVYLSLSLFPSCLPEYQGILKIGSIGAFCLNFIGVDLLYYWQHRFFHHVPFLWQLHQCHHSAPKVNIWATSRNNITINFIFVYLLINPLLGFLCDNPACFFMGAMITASLDVLKHTEIDFSKIPILNRVVYLLSFILVMPKEHHQHHNALKTKVNFGANLILWDKLFGTAYSSEYYPSHYSLGPSHSLLHQLLYPFSFNRYRSSPPQVKGAL